MQAAGSWMGLRLACCAAGRRGTASPPPHWQPIPAGICSHNALPLLPRWSLQAAHTFPHFGNPHQQYQLDYRLDYIQEVTDAFNVILSQVYFHNFAYPSLRPTLLAFSAGHSIKSSAQRSSEHARQVDIQLICSNVTQESHNSQDDALIASKTVGAPGQGRGCKDGSEDGSGTFPAARLRVDRRSPARQSTACLPASTRMGTCISCRPCAISIVFPYRQGIMSCMSPWLSFMRSDPLVKALSAIRSPR